MNEQQLIAEQALKIANLEKLISEYRKAAKNIFNIIYCIGGPLNDNKKGYKKDQMYDFKLIHDEVEVILYTEKDDL